MNEILRKDPSMYKIAVIMICLTSLKLYAQWGPDIRLTYELGDSYTSKVMQAKNIICLGDTLHIVWYDNRPGYPNAYGIYYKRSCDNGLTWGDDTLLASESQYPSIEGDNPFLFLVWNNADLNICFMRSSDGGRTWSQPTLLVDSDSFSLYPVVASVSPYVHMAWTDKRNGFYEVFYKRSTDNGLTWESDNQLTINTNIGIRDESVCIEAIGQYVYVLWHRYDELFPESTEVYIRKSTDFGANFLPEERMTYTNYGTGNPRVSCVDSIVYLFAGGLFMRSFDFGETWSCTTLVNFVGTFACIDSHINVVRGGYYTTISYFQSHDFGNSWTNDTILVSSYQNLYPFIATSGEAVHIIWCKISPNLEIFYKRNPNANYIQEKHGSMVTSSYIYPTICKSHSIVSCYIPKETRGQIILLNSLGQQLGTIESEYRLADIRDIDLRRFYDIPAGVYFIQIMTDDSRTIQKLVVVD